MSIPVETAVGASQRRRVTGIKQIPIIPALSPRAQQHSSGVFSTLPHGIPATINERNIENINLFYDPPPLKKFPKWYLLPEETTDSGDNVKEQNKLPPVALRVLTQKALEFTPNPDCVQRVTLNGRNASLEWANFRKLVELFPYTAHRELERFYVGCGGNFQQTIEKLSFAYRQGELIVPRVRRNMIDENRSFVPRRLVQPAVSADVPDFPGLCALHTDVSKSGIKQEKKLLYTLPPMVNFKNAEVVQSTAQQHDPDIQVLSVIKKTVVFHGGIGHQQLRQVPRGTVKLLNTTEMTRVAHHTDKDTGSDEVEFLGVYKAAVPNRTLREFVLPCGNQPHQPCFTAGQRASKRQLCQEIAYPGALKRTTRVSCLVCNLRQDNPGPSSCIHRLQAKRNG